MRKRAISLIEVIVSLGLLTLLLSALFYWHYSLTQQKAKCNSLKGPLMEERYAHQRLQHLFSKIETPLITTLSNGSLVFIFDRGPSCTPELSGQILGCLYHDEKTESLCLGIWPHPDTEKKEPSQTCMILDGVISSSFEFYYPSDPFKKPVAPDEVGKIKPQERWQTDWKTSYKCLPALIKMTIIRKEKKPVDERMLEYLFDFPVPVIYTHSTSRVEMI